jgi:hypothetical protein
MRFDTVVIDYEFYGEGVITGRRSAVYKKKMQVQP